MTGRVEPLIQQAGKRSASPGPAVSAHTRGGDRQSKSSRTKGRQAKGRLAEGGLAPQPADKEFLTQTGCQGPRSGAAAGLRPHSAAEPRARPRP